MAISKFIRDLIAKADKADKGLDELAVAVVEGEKVNDNVIERACLLTGNSLKDFANRVEVLEERRALWNAAHGRDWGAEQKALGAEIRSARESSKSVTAEIKALQAESQRLSDADRRLSGNLTGIQNEEREARNACEFTLRKSGSPDDWRAVGEPQPRKTRLQQMEEAAQRGENTKIDIGSRQLAT